MGFMVSGRMGRIWGGGRAGKKEAIINEKGRTALKGQGPYPLPSNSLILAPRHTRSG